jgi:hypothetical protein
MLKVSRAEPAGDEEHVVGIERLLDCGGLDGRPRSSTTERVVEQMRQSKSSRIFIDFNRVTGS